jgi:hypothetical protein
MSQQKFNLFCLQDEKCVQTLILWIILQNWQPKIENYIEDDTIQIEYNIKTTVSMFCIINYTSYVWYLLIINFIDISLTMLFIIT